MERRTLKVGGTNSWAGILVYIENEKPAVLHPSLSAS